MTRAIAAAIAVLWAWVAFGQSTANPPAFEVAAVKANTSNDAFPAKGRILHGQVELHNVSLREFIMAAYGVRANMITAGPKWLESDRFDIVAKAPSDTPEPSSPW